MQASIQRRFGSMRNAMNEAGLPYLSRRETQRLSWQRRKAAGYDDHYRGVHWTDGNLLRLLRHLEKQHGYVSMNLLDQNGQTPSAYYFVKRFGSLAGARQLAHLPPRTHSQILLEALKRKREGKAIGPKPRDPLQRSCRRYRADDILHGLRRLANRQGIVSGRLINEDANLPSWDTVVNYFGSLSAAYKLAGLIRLPGKSVRFGLPPRE
jgi:hypothetical protein